LLILGGLQSLIQCLSIPDSLLAIPIFPNLTRDTLDTLCNICKLLQLVLHLALQPLTAAE
jgi:hypothetical protein